MEPPSEESGSLKHSKAGSKANLLEKSKLRILGQEVVLNTITEEELLADQELWKVSDSDSDEDQKKETAASDKRLKPYDRTARNK